MDGKPPKAAAQPAAAAPAEPFLADELKKYLKMMKMHIPNHAIENKMRQDGIDVSRMEEVSSPIFVCVFMFL